MESEIAGMGVDGGGSGLETRRHQLLPGFPDDETFVNIVPKLPWKCFDSLASNSLAWLHAVRSREVYDARVSYRVLKPFVILRYALNNDASFDRLGLYSTRDGFYFELPSLPVCAGGIPDDCKCVTLDEKIYALGGKLLDYHHVYVLDLAGRRQWKKCASMLRQKLCCGSVALDGKVYVVGSTFKGVRFTEVYDPKADIWSLIGPMQLGEEVQLGIREEVIERSFPFGPPQVIARDYEIGVREEQQLAERDHFLDSLVHAVGEELFVICEDLDEDDEFTFMANVYDRVKDKWRVDQLYPSIDYSGFRSPTLFSAQGKLYRIQNGCIYVLDMDTQTWTLRHCFSFPGNERHAYTIITVGNELLALVGVHSECCWLLQSEGFGGENVDITWHKDNLCPSYCFRDFRGMYRIEL